MSDVATWHQTNDAYLAAALAWLRLRLIRLANQAQPPTPIPAPIVSAAVTASASARPVRWGIGGRRTTATVAGQPTAPPPTTMLLLPAEVVTDEQVQQAESEMDEAGATTPLPALLLLAERLGLTPFERAVLLLCAAMELDTRTARLCYLAQDDPTRPYPTFGLALTLFDEPSWDVLSPERPLRYWRLLEIVQPAGQPLTASALRADERIVNYIKGLNYLDDRLSPLVVRLNAGNATALPPSQQAIVEQLMHQLAQSDQNQRLPVIQLLGSDTASKQQVAHEVAAAFKLDLYRFPAELMSIQAAELETLARLWQRENMLLPLALYLDAPAGEAGAAPVYRFLARSNGLFFFDTRDLQSGVGDATLAFDIEKPTTAEQHDAWSEALASYAAAHPEIGAFQLNQARLADQFNLTTADIQRISQATLADTTDANAATLNARMWEACRRSLRPKVDTLAQRIDVRATWDEIVLPDEALGLLHQIASQVGQRGKVYQEWGFAERMNRGLGISALFAGASGTGKTMAAEVIANELRLDLYRIDLSAVMSKYIGETEKNLRKLFDAVEAGGAILFFDEADALFGKRSEVKDSHDRYANIEINYLLQRMEAYRGLAILATNMKSALDTAFLRRLRFVVDFPFPGPAERRQMWQKAFPGATPTDALEYERLARLNLTGGNIHTVAINAAFMAASAETPIDMPLVLRAARAEFRKLDRPINEAEFR